MSTEKSTSWAEFSQWDTCNKYKGEKFSTWSIPRIKYVKKDELNKRGGQWDLSAVCYNLTTTRKSALLYCYDFGFNIPKDSEITKVVVKQVFCGDDKTNGRVTSYRLNLKTGASTSDLGVGNNVSDKVKWRTHRYAHRNGMQYNYIGDTSKSVKEFWGVELTPSIVNSKDFGVIIQCNASSTKTGHKAYLDVVNVKIYYKKAETKPTKTVDNKEEVLNADNSMTYTLSRDKQETVSTKKDKTGKSTVLKTHNTIEKNTLATSDDPIPYDNPNMIKFFVRYQNNVVSDSKKKKYLIDAKSKKLLLVSDSKVLFDNNSNKKTIESLTVKGSNDTNYVNMGFNWYFLEQYCFINPDIVNSWNDKTDDTSTITLYTADDTNTKLATLTFYISEGNSNIPYSQTILRNCVFESNHSNKGSAIYNTGRLYTENLEFYDNQTYGTTRDKCQFYDVDICRKHEVTETKLILTTVGTAQLNKAQVINATLKLADGKLLVGKQVQISVKRSEPVILNQIVENNDNTTTKKKVSTDYAVSQIVTTNDRGVASIKYTYQAKGTYIITAKYNSDGRYKTSTSELTPTLKAKRRMLKATTLSSDTVETEAIVDEIVQTEQVIVDKYDTKLDIQYNKENLEIGQTIPISVVLSADTSFTQNEVVSLFYDNNNYDLELEVQEDGTLHGVFDYNLNENNNVIECKFNGSNDYLEASTRAVIIVVHDTSLKLIPSVTNPVVGEPMDLMIELSDSDNTLNGMYEVEVKINGKKEVVKLYTENEEKEEED